MPNVTGIKFIKDAKKNNRYVTIDLKKHGEAINPLLTKLGALKKTQFDIDFENGITIEEARERAHKFIKKLWETKK